MPCASVRILTNSIFTIRSDFQSTTGHLMLAQMRQHDNDITQQLPVRAYIGRGAAAITRSNRCISERATMC